MRIASRNLTPTLIQNKGRLAELRFADGTVVTGRIGTVRLDQGRVYLDLTGYDLADVRSADIV